METYSLTFGDVAENHAGMEKIGQLAKEGFSVDKLKSIAASFDEKKSIKIYDLDALLGKEMKSGAALLYVPGGVDLLLGEGMADKLLKEMSSYTYDKKALMRGRIVNKKARWNNCFSDYSQEPDYEKGKGTIINFKDTTVVRELRNKLQDITNEKLVMETNYYYNVKDNYIGFHGDTERKIVICARLGASFPLYYQWYHQCKAVSKIAKLDLNHGDLYIMSAKAVGNDWKKRSQYTLRHAAGSEKALKLH